MRLLCLLRLWRRHRPRVCLLLLVLVRLLCLLHRLLLCGDLRRRGLAQLRRQRTGCRRRGCHAHAAAALRRQRRRRCQGTNAKVAIKVEAKALQAETPGIEASWQRQRATCHLPGPPNAAVLLQQLLPPDLLQRLFVQRQGPLLCWGWWVLGLLVL